MNTMMTFEAAADLVKTLDPTGRGSLLRGCEYVKELVSGYDCWEEAPVSWKEYQAYRTVCREMSKLFV